MKKEPKPAKLSTKEKYKRLGLARTDHQRGVMYLLIERSAKGEWMRHCNAGEEGIANSIHRIAELMCIRGTGIKRRVVPGLDCNGNQTKYSEFCVVE